TLAVFDKSGRTVFSISKLHLRRLSRRDLPGHKKAYFEESFRRVVWSESSLTAPAVMKAGRWLIFADAGGTGADLAKLLLDHGQDSVLAYRTPVAGKDREGLLVSPANPSELDSLLAGMKSNLGAPWLGILYLWGLDANHQNKQEHPLDAE